VSASSELLYSALDLRRVKSQSGFRTIDPERKSRTRAIRIPQFFRYSGIDYSRAETADYRRGGIRVFMAEGSGEPIQVQQPPSQRPYQLFKLVGILPR